MLGLSLPAWSQEYSRPVVRHSRATHAKTSSQQPIIKHTGQYYSHRPATVSEEYTEYTQPPVNSISYDSCTVCDSCGVDACSCSSCNCGNCDSCLCLDQCPPACLDCNRVSTLDQNFNIQIFGAVKLDMLFNNARPASPGVPFYLFPESPRGLDESTVDINSRQSNIGAALVGPQIGDFQAGGMLLVNFYDNNVLADQYGVLPLQAYGDLKNDEWRFAAGLQFDVFSPGAPTILPFSALGASGNAGNSFRGQIRVEHYRYPSEDMQWTCQLALSEPIVSTINPDFALSEDNGWPNVEGRVALGLGPLDGTQRPFELGLSGVVGEIRNTPAAPDDRVVAEVWGTSIDLRYQMSDRFGIAGEIFKGETLGTYNAGILQGINTDTLQGIESEGGWFEVFLYWKPCLHSHFGYGIDDPKNADVHDGGRIKNETYYTNLLWDMTDSFRLGFEFTWRETQYQGPDDLDNEGPGFHTQAQWTF